MTDKSPYKDIRKDFFRHYFESGLPYDKFLETGDPRHSERWLEYERASKFSPQHLEILHSFKRTMHVIVLAGLWCGDCTRQCPMLHLIEQESKVIQFRFLDNKSNPELQDELRINGAEKVPVILSLSEDFYEVGRFGDRHLSVYRRKAAQEQGAACDAGILLPPAEHLQTEITEWVEYFERLQIMLRLAPALRKRYCD